MGLLKAAFWNPAFFLLTAGLSLEFALPRGPEMGFCVMVCSSCSHGRARPARGHLDFSSRHHTWRATSKLPVCAEVMSTMIWGVKMVLLLGHLGGSVN